MTAFRDLRALVGYALTLEEQVEDLAHQLAHGTPTGDLRALEPTDLLSDTDEG